jgi:hypothetical protein
LVEAVSWVLSPVHIFVFSVSVNPKFGKSNVTETVPVSDVFNALIGSAATFDRSTRTVERRRFAFVICEDTVSSVRRSALLYKEVPASS